MLFLLSHTAPSWHADEAEDDNMLLLLKLHANKLTRANSARRSQGMPYAASACQTAISNDLTTFQHNRAPSHSDPGKRSDLR